MAKQWVEAEGDSYLIESVDYEAVASALAGPRSAQVQPSAPAVGTGAGGELATIPRVEASRSERSEAGSDKGTAAVPRTFRWTDLPGLSARSAAPKARKG